jgi:hypothetical protein
MAAIYSTEHAFAALKADGSIMAWGGSTHGGSGEPTDSDYIKIYSTEYAFAALDWQRLFFKWACCTHRLNSPNFKSSVVCI